MRRATAISAHRLAFTGPGGGRPLDSQSRQCRCGASGCIRLPHSLRALATHAQPDAAVPHQERSACIRRKRFGGGPSPRRDHHSDVVVDTNPRLRPDTARTSGCAREHGVANADRSERADPNGGKCPHQPARALKPALRGNSTFDTSAPLRAHGACVARLRLRLTMIAT